MMNRLTLLALLAVPICQAAASVEIEAVEGSGYDDDAAIAILGSGSGDVEPTPTPPDGNPPWQRKPQHHGKFPPQGSVTKPSQQRILGSGKKQGKGHDDYPPPPPGHPGHHHDGPRPDGPHGHPDGPPPHHSSSGGFDYLGLSPNVFIACAVAAGVVVLVLLVCIFRKCRRDKCCRCCSKGAIGAASSGSDDTEADTRILINGQYGTVITKAVVDKGKLAGGNPVPPPPGNLAVVPPRYNLAHSAGAAPPNYISDAAAGPSTYDRMSASATSAPASIV